MSDKPLNQTKAAAILALASVYGFCNLIKEYNMTNILRKLHNKAWNLKHVIS